MKAFKLTGIENKIYFQNLNRIPPEEELATVLKELKVAGYTVGKRKSAGLYDIYTCEKDDRQFMVFFDGEDAEIYSRDQNVIEELMKLFAE